MDGLTSVTNINTKRNDIIIAQFKSTALEKIFHKSHCGKVHSIFQSSLNLQIGTRIVHIGPLDNGLAPFGIGIHQRDIVRVIQQAEKEEEVTWNPTTKTLVLSSGLLISLRQAEIINHLLEAHPFNNITLRENQNILINKVFEANYQTGFIQTTDEQNIIKEYLSGALSEYDHSIAKRMDELISLVTDVRSSSFDSVLDYWIGRGIGLTPSGDDMITGMCAILATYGRLTIHFRKQLRNYLLKKGLKQTTFIGYEYLCYAAEKQYHTHLLEMCKALLNPQKNELSSAMKTMQKIGHTSGIDTLIGVLLGLKAVDSD